MANVEQLAVLAVAVFPSRVVAVGHGPPSGYAGLAREYLVACVPILVGLGQSDRAGPDHGKVPGQYVEELHHLVERGATQEAADFSHAGIVVELLLALPGFELFGGHVFLRMIVRIGDHGPQLVDVDALAAFADALLPENGSTGRIKRNRDAGGRHGYRQDNANRNTEANIESALDEEVYLPAFLWRASGRVGSRRNICHVLILSNDWRNRLDRDLFGTHYAATPNAGVRQ